MCTMCHVCGADLTKVSNGKKNQTNENHLKLDGGAEGLRCKFCNEMKDNEFMKREVLSPYESPTISPTTSLSSSDSSVSSCSEFSVDMNPCYRSNEEDGTMQSSHEDSSYRARKLNGFVPETSLTAAGRANISMGNNIMESNNGCQRDNDRDVEIMQGTPFKGDEVAENETSHSLGDEMESRVWDPPEPEDPEDDTQGSMTYNDDDEDECDYGTKWGKPSSLSNFADEVTGSRSFRLKEEKKKALDEVINGRFKVLVSQLLKSFGVDSLTEGGESWVDIITALSWEAASFLKPDAVEGRGICPDGFVKVKCIATGRCSESQVVRGLVFKKRAAHKHMPTSYKNPKLLLIQGVLGQSSSGLSSFNTMKQEDYLKPFIEMIEMCHPNVILVEKSVSRDVQESILAKGMTLVFDMKLHRLERIARCTGSSIVSIDTLTIQKLKQCESFHIDKFVEEHAGFCEGGKKPSKTLMFLEGYPLRLGCTILLKGSHSDELKRIKSVVQCSVGVAYHLILETAFLVDQRAMFSTIPFVRIPDSPRNHQSPTASKSSGIHDPGVDEYAIGLSSCTVKDVPISSGLHDEDSLHTNSESGGNSPFSYEPYNPVIFSGFSSLSNSLKRVIGDNFPLVSTCPSLSGYFGFNRKEPNGHTESADAVDIHEMKTNGHFDEDKPHDEGPNQSSLASFNKVQQMGEGGHFNDQIGNSSDMTTSLDTRSILVLMSRRNALKGITCEQSHFSRITFYKNFDVPLGKFLQDNILNQRSQCNSCGELPEAHFYYYAHHNEQLTIQVKRLPVDKQLPGEGEGKLWMWSRCGKCKSGNGTMRSTKRVLISTAARCLSFGKFLELSFSHHSSFTTLANCGHSLQRDFLYFFGLGPVVAMFRYSPVTCFSVSMPPQKLEFTNSIQPEWLAKEIEKVHMKGKQLFAEVEGAVKKIGPQVKGSLHHKDLPRALSEIEETLKQESYEFELSIQNAVKNGNPRESSYRPLTLNRLWWELLLESFIWDQRLYYLLSANPPKVAVGNGIEEPSGYESKMDDALGRGNKWTNSGEKEVISREILIEESLQVDGDSIVKEENPVRENKEQDSCEDFERPVERNLNLTISSGEVLSRPAASCYINSGNVETPLFPDHSDLGRSIQSSSGPLSNGSASENKSQHFTFQISLFSASQNSSLWLWKRFPEIQETYMNELRRGYAPRFQFSSQTLDFLATAHQLNSEEGSRLHIPLEDDKYVVSDYESELSSIIACALALLKDQPAVTEPVADNSRSDSLVSSIAAETMQNLLRLPSSTSIHYSLNVSSDSDSVHSTRSTSSEESRLSSFDGLVLLDSLLPSENFKAEVSLGVTKSMVKGKYTVVCLYANEFRDLRSLCCLSEIDFIASLSRCRDWDAKGGKSKSFFAKTLDDRFIIKEIKKTEFESFEKFAPHYFKYMKQSFESGNQTCLAKVLGIYQVTLRQTKSGKEARHDLMVMENLTCGRNITRQYDLKGALHDRFNSATDGTGDVLLDQNFVEDMNSSPLYVSNGAKHLLQRAVWNDTSFLNSINVMDYSLLVGVDKQKQELVCGIIDYLRQYTWDKQLETWVKSSLYVPKNVLPTVISPKEYKKRFRKFMSAHFLCIPDDWCSQGSSDACEICTRNDDPSKLKVQKQGDMNGFTE